MQIALGAMSDPISQQIEEAGMMQVGVPVEMLDRLNSSIILAFLHGCLTDAEYRKAQRRLMKKISVRSNA